jgi:hypothetical protein
MGKKVGWEKAKALTVKNNSPKRNILICLLININAIPSDFYVIFLFNFKVQNYTKNDRGQKSMQLSLFFLPLWIIWS